MSYLYRGLFGGILIASFACTKATIVTRKTNQKTRVQTLRWLQTVEKLAEDGDWLATRGYHDSDNLVAVATNGELSHLAMYDKEKGEVIEAVSPKVRAVKLQYFLRHAHRLVLIRPHKLTPNNRKAAVKKARSVIGKKYDFLGTVGLPSTKKFYCSELVAWAVGLQVDKQGPNGVFPPKHSPKYGKVLFDSGNRY